MEDKKESGKKRSRGYDTESAAKIPKIVKESITDVIRAKEEGKPIAYTFIQCAYDEIIRAMDIVPSWTENFAGICGAKRDTTRFLEKAQEENFSRSLCTYALCGIGFDIWREELGEMPPDAPWGGQPKPDVMLSSGQIVCDPRNKWYQAVQHYTPDVPIYNLGLPLPPYDPSRDHHKIEGDYVSYMVEQLKGLVVFLEEHTNRKMDWDKLREVNDLSERTWDIAWKALELRKAVPTPMGTGDAMNTMVPMVFFMGTQLAYDFYKDMYDELKAKVDKNLGVTSDEKYRLIWGGGLPPWFALTDFNYFKDKGAVFPVEITYRIVELIDNLDLSEVNDPLERIAWRYFRFWTYWYDQALKRPGSTPELERIIKYIEAVSYTHLRAHET